MTDITVKKYCECCGYRSEYNTSYANNPYIMEQRGKECPKCHCKTLHITVWAYLHAEGKMKDYGVKFSTLSKMIEE